MSLHDDEPLDLKEQRALSAALQSPEAESWWAGLPANTRRAVIQKLLASLAKAETPRDIGTLTRSLVMMDKVDLERAKLALEERKGETPEQHLHLHGGPAQMFQDVIKAIRERDAIPAPRIEPATAEPASDDK